MPLTTLTTKGQMVIPIEVREKLGLKGGDRLAVSVEGDHILIVPLKRHLEDIVSLLPASEHVLTDDQLREAKTQGHVKGAGLDRAGL